MITTHQNGGALTVLLAARAINPFSRLFQRELAALLEKLELRRGKLDSVIIGFDAGPHAASHELEHLMALTPAQAADCMHMLHAYNRLLQRLENLGLPVIAALDGDISGHAFGLALACQHRLALHDARFSLPQVRLGLAPVAGEIVRTVRLAGLQAAMPLLLEGAVLDAQQARHAGLLHAIAADPPALARLTAAVHASTPRRSRPRDGELRSLLQTAPARLRQRAQAASPATEAILCAMVEGTQVDFDNALLIESRYFCQTAINPAAEKGRFSL